jgi:hypothetical protein
MNGEGNSGVRMGSKIGVETWHPIQGVNEISIIKVVAKKLLEKGEGE